jgi:riboflavin synthase alpha subunit
MFTGIVQGKGTVVSIDEKPNFRTHVVRLPEAWRLAHRWLTTDAV